MTSDFEALCRRSGPVVRVRGNHQRQGRDAGQQHPSSGLQAPRLF